VSGCVGCGKASGFAAEIDLAAVAAGNGGFVIHGQDGADFSGNSVSSAGHVNTGGGCDQHLATQVRGVWARGPAPPASVRATATCCSARPPSAIRSTTSVTSAPPPTTS